MRPRVVAVLSMVLVALFLAVTGGASSARFAATGPGQVGVTPTMAMYLSAIRRPENTPTAQPTVTPNPQETDCINSGPPQADGFQVWVTQLNVVPQQQQTLCAQLIRDGLGVAGASVVANVSLPSGSLTLGPTLTANNGFALIVFNVGAAPGPGSYTVGVSADVTDQGQTYSGFTTFCFISTRRLSPKIVICD
jgi:hypothetical protein